MSIGPRRQRQASKRHSSRDIDYGSIVGAVARKLLGEPNARLGKGSELRFGTHGSVCVRRKEKNGEFPPRHRDVYRGSRHRFGLTWKSAARTPAVLGLRRARRMRRAVVPKRSAEPLRASRRVSRTTDTEITD